MQFNNLSSYEEFLIKKNIYGINTIDILNKCNQIKKHKDRYYFWPEDGILTVFDKNGDKINNPDITIVRRSIIPETSIKTCVIPDGVKEIHEYAFPYCRKLKSIAIPSTVEEIGERAFMICLSLKSVVIPDGVKSVHYQAFKGCKSLEHIVFQIISKKSEMTF